MKICAVDDADVATEVDWIGMLRGEFAAREFGAGKGPEGPMPKRTLAVVFVPNIVKTVPRLVDREELVESIVRRAESDLEGCRLHDEDGIREIGLVNGRSE